MYRTLTIALVAALTACERGAPSDRDSGQVVLLSHGEEVGRVDSVPRAVAGEGNAPQDALHYARDAVMLPDGSIAVLQQGAKGIVVFDSVGSYRRTIGRAGDGPGEFRGLSILFRGAGDSLVAFDEKNKRLSIHDPAGAYVRSVHLTDLMMAIQGPVRNPMPVGTFRTGGFASLTSGIASGLGWVRTPHAIVTADAAGTLVGTLATGLTSEALVSQLPGRDIKASWWPAHARVVGAAVIDDEIFTNDGTVDISVYTSDGRLSRILRAPLSTRTIGPAEIEAIAAEQHEGGATYAAAIRKAPPRDTLPVFRTMAASRDGRLWLERPNLSTDSIREWVVVDPVARTFGTVVAPRAGRLVDAGRDFVLVLAPNADGADIVRVYHLTEGPSR